MTTKLAPETYIQLWEAAAEQEIGIEVLCDPKDQTKLVNAIYECRNILGGYDDLMLAQPQPPGTIFIMKKMVEELPG